MHTKYVEIDNGDDNNMILKMQKRVKTNFILNYYCMYVCVCVWIVDGFIMYLAQK